MSGMDMLAAVQSAINRVFDSDNGCAPVGADGKAVLAMPEMQALRNLALWFYDEHVAGAPAGDQDLLWWNTLPQHVQEWVRK
jgi:hypothetical protein